MDTETVTTKRVSGCALERRVMPLANGYSFTIELIDRKICIELTQDATGKVKSFSQYHGCVGNMIKHMRSLTDTQCCDWFKGKKIKGHNVELTSSALLRNPA